jgi:hypothetical protein
LEINKKERKLDICMDFSSPSRIQEKEKEKYGSNLAESFRIDDGKQGHL